MKYLLIISLLFLFSCKKERTFHITAKNAVTGEPYPGLSYEIQRSWSGPYEDKYKSVGSGVLDENGETYFTKRLHKNSSYSMSVAPPPNTCYISSSSLYAKGEENFNAAFEFAECATLQRKVTNVNCIDASDKIEIYIDNTMHSTLDIPWVLNGCANTTTSPSKVPIGTYTLHWIVTKNNISSDFYDTFNLVVNETKIYEINY